MSTIKCIDFCSIIKIKIDLNKKFPYVKNSTETELSDFVRMNVPVGESPIKMSNLTLII